MPAKEVKVAAEGEEKLFTKKVARPDKNALEKNLEDIQSEVKKLQAKMSAVQTTLNGTDNVKVSYSGKIDGLRAKLDELSKKRAEVNADRNKLMEKVKAISAGIKKKFEESRSAKDQLKTVGDIEQRIINLDKLVSSGTLTMQEEKKVVAEISSLRKQRKLIEAAPAGSQASTIESDKAQVETLKKQLDLLKPVKDEINAQYDTVKAELSTIEASKKKDLDSLSTLINQKKDLKAQIDKLFDDMRTLRNDFKKQNDDWFNATKIEREKKQKEYQEQKKQEELEKLSLLAEKELEDAKIPAFTDEINTCNALIAFLSQYSATAKNTAATAAEVSTPSVFAATNIRKVESALPQGAVAFKKKDDRDEDYLVMGGKGKKKKNVPVGSPSALPTKNFKIDPVTLALFSKLKVDIPVSAADIDASIQAIVEKKAQYTSDQAAQTLKNREAAEAKIAVLKEKAAAGSVEEALKVLEAAEETE